MFRTRIEKARGLGRAPGAQPSTSDGNKRSAFLAMERFLAVNGRPLLDAEPDVDVPMVERIAAGDATSAEIAGWLEARIAATR